MPGPWVTDEEVMRGVADFLHKSGTGLPELVQRLCIDGNADAAADITAILIGRGYTLAQIDTWDRRAVYNLRLAKFWAVTNLGGLGEYSDTMLAKFDCRKELAGLTLTSGGTVIIPGSATTGTDVIGGDGIPDTFGGANIGGGVMDDTYYRFPFTKEF